MAGHHVPGLEVVEPLHVLDYDYGTGHIKIVYLRHDHFSIVEVFWCRFDQTWGFLSGRFSKMSFGFGGLSWSILMGLVLYGSVEIGLLLGVVEIGDFQLDFGSLWHGDCDIKSGPYLFQIFQSPLVYKWWEEFNGHRSIDPPNRLNDPWETRLVIVAMMKYIRIKTISLTAGTCPSASIYSNRKVADWWLSRRPLNIQS